VRGHILPGTAGVAQSVEHLICNQRVRGSNPFASSRKQRHEFPAVRADSGSSTTSFPNTLHSEFFRRVVVIRGAGLNGEFREPWFPCVANVMLGLIRRVSPRALGS
jgi:hypothetical protein